MSSDFDADEVCIQVKITTNKVSFINGSKNCKIDKLSLRTLLSTVVLYMILIKKKLLLTAL